MKQLIFKSLIFALLSTVVLTYVLDPIFKDVNLNNKTFSDFIQKKDSIDILILGSSHAKNTYTPELIDSVFKTKTYNLSTGGQLLLVTNYLLEDILGQKKPKLLIVDLYPTVMYLPGLKKSKAFQLRVFDNTPFSLSKLKTVNKIYDFNEQPSVFSETIRNHDQWYDRNWRLEEYQLSKKTNYSNGFLGSEKIMGQKDKMKFKDFVQQYDQFLNIIPNKKDSLKFINQTKELNHLISYCKENEIKLMLVSAPYFPSFYQKSLNKFHYSLNKHLKNSELTFKDFNKDFNTLGLELNDFSNQGHLNVTGSNKVTTGLIEEISKTGLLTIENPSYFENLVNKIKPRKENTNSNNKQKTGVEEIINQLVSTGVSYKVSHSVNDNLDIETVYFSLNNNQRYIVLETSNKKLNLDHNYFLVSKTVNKTDFDKRPKWQLGTDKNKLHWEAYPKFTTINDKNYMLLVLDKKCEITKFDEIRIVLKDHNTKKSVLGAKPLTIKKVSVIK